MRDDPAGLSHRVETRRHNAAPWRVRGVARSGASGHPIVPSPPSFRSVGYIA